MNLEESNHDELKEVLHLLTELDKKVTESRLLDYKPYDYQMQFHNVQDRRGLPANQKFLQAANQIGKCNSVRVKILTTEGEKRIGDIFGKEYYVIDRHGDPQRVRYWVKKPAEECFRITMADGRWVEVPKGHLILSNQGWISVGALLEDLPQSVFYHPRSISEFSLKAHVLSVLRYCRRPLDYLGDCLASPRLYGGQLLSDEDSVQVYIPLPGDGPAYTSIWSRLDARACRYINNLRQSWCRLSNWYDDSPTSGRFFSRLTPSFAYAGRWLSDYSQNARQSSITEYHQQPSEQSHHHQSSGSSGICPQFSPESLEGNKIISVYSVGRKVLYDMEVENTHSYQAGGLIHHNTYCAALEIAMHATGEYPVWYTGIRLEDPKTIQVSGVTNETTRDICQAELFGDPEDDTKLGTGAIPKANIVQTYRKPGIPNAFDSVRVKHKKGHEVTIKLKAYEAGFKKFMGSRNDACWLDEEPPYDIWSQILRSQFARPGSIILATFTPENGVTQLVAQINDDIQDGQGLIIAAWEDADHIAGVEGRMEYLLSQLSPHERDMRSKGLPLMGSGLIFPVPDDQIMIDPMPIPEHWKRINGMDFGYDHPSAVAFCAYDEENDVVYMYDEFSQSHTLPPIVASAIKHRGDWIPCIWPHDGMSVADKQTGKAMKDLYLDEGVNMAPSWFTNPPTPDKNGRTIEGSGGNSVEAGLISMLTRMETGRFKVFSTCTEFFREKAIYHRKNVNGQSQVVKLNDDVISAVRYAVQSLRHAEREVVYVPEPVRRVGARNW